MRITYNSIKNQDNIRERGLSFERARDFDFATAVAAQDLRKSYPEVRYVALGMLDNRLHVLCWTPIGDDGIHVISFRKANKREVKRYEEATSPD